MKPHWRVSGPNTAPPSVHWGRSPDGLWVRATRGPVGVQVEAQERIQWEGSTWVRLGPDGQEVARGRPVELRTMSEWTTLGSLPLPLATVRALAPLVQFDGLAFGLMRHAVGLIVGGWGERASEVPGWFDPLDGGAWVVAEASYELVGPWSAPFTEDLAGGMLRGVRYGDGLLTADMRVLDRVYPVRWEGPRALGAFAIGAVLDLAR